MVRESAAILTVLIIVVVAYLFASGRLSLSPSAPAGVHQVGPVGQQLAVDESWEPTLPYAGTLEGSFLVANGTAELCITTWISWDLGTSPACPANATYDSGVVTSGTIHAIVTAGPLWLSVLG